MLLMAGNAAADGFQQILMLDSQELKDAMRMIDAIREQEGGLGCLDQGEAHRCCTPWGYAPVMSPAIARYGW